MGNSNSSPTAPPKHSSVFINNFETIIDLGMIEPQSNIYATSYLEYSRPIVHRLIIERKLSPFYLGLDEFEPDYSLEQILLALQSAQQQSIKNLEEALEIANQQQTDSLETSNNSSTTSPQKKSKESIQAQAQTQLHRERLLKTLKLTQSLRPLSSDHKNQIANLYVGKAVDCPICFLYFPPPLVHTRCCDQPICTECFVQIKRIDPTTTHLESEPAACPFCMEPNFGVIFQKIEEVPPRPSSSALPSCSNESSNPAVPVKPKIKPRRKSFAHTEKAVVTTDQVHPDWQQKLDAIRATVARRANRRIVFRQVGDRLVPVGITSGRASDGSNATMSTATLPPEFASQIAAALDSHGSGNHDLSTREGRRAARRRNEEMSNFLTGMGLGVGVELEEMMMAEAMRLSVLEEEERKKKVREEEQTREEQNEDDKPLGETYSSNNTRNLLSEAIDSPIAGPSLVIPSTSALSTSPISTYGTPINSSSLFDIPHPSTITSSTGQDVFGEIISPTKIIESEVVESSVVENSTSESRVLE